MTRFQKLREIKVRTDARVKMFNSIKRILREHPEAKWCKYEGSVRI